MIPQISSLTPWYFYSYSNFNIKKLAAWAWWHIAFNARNWGEEAVRSLLVQGQPGLYSMFQTIQNYMGRSALKNKRKERKAKENS